MSCRSWLRVVACHIIVISLAGLCGDATLARPIPEPPQAALSPVLHAPVYAPPALTEEPFGLGLTHNGALAIRWQSLQPVIRVEARVLALCRSHPQFCPPEAARFLAIIDAARARNGRARIGEINRAVNLAIRPARDLAQFGVPDVWTTPLMTFARGAGDCEDYAIAKYVALLEAGMAAEDVRLVIMHDRATGEDHAVVAARLDGQWLILDNRTMVLLADWQLHHITPLFAFGNAGSTPPRVIVDLPGEPVPVTPVVMRAAAVPAA